MGGMVWDNYPEGVLEQALEENERAVAEFGQRKVCDPDPYNVSFKVLIKRWLSRQQQDCFGDDD